MTYGYLINILSAKIVILVIFIILVSMSARLRKSRGGLRRKYCSVFSGHWNVFLCQRARNSNHGLSPGPLQLAAAKVRSVHVSAGNDSFVRQADRQFSPLQDQT